MDRFKDFYRKVLESVSEPVLVIDNNRRIIYKNKAASDFLEGASGDTCHEIFHKRTEKCNGTDWPCPCRMVMETDAPVVAEHDHNGHEKPRRLEIYAAPLRDDDGELVGFVQSARDITEKKEFERQKEDFLAMITHDLKSPLTSITVYSELLAGSLTDNQDAANSAGVIKRNAEKLAAMVDDFLTLLRAQTGNYAPDLSPVKLNELVRETAEEMKAEAVSKGLDFAIDISEDMPELPLDKKLVARAVANLLQNAFKFTPSGGRVSLKAGMIMDDVPCLFVSVSDTGPGIPPEEQPFIFNRYFSSIKARGRRGSGLGLSIVKAAAESHQGFVELNSEVGKGSEFRIYFPVKP